MRRALGSSTLVRGLALAALAVLVLGGVGGAWIWSHAEAWKMQGVDAVNTRLNGEVEPASIHVSWWHGFPDVSIDLVDVVLLEADGDTLGTFERVGLELDLWTLVAGAPAVSSVVVDGGKLQVRVSAAGELNLTALAQSDLADTSGVAVAIQRVVVRNLAFDGVSERDGWRVSGKIDDADLRDLDQPPWKVDVEARDLHLQGLEGFDLRPLDLALSATLAPTEDGVSAEGTSTVQGIRASWNVQLPASSPWAAEVHLPKVKLTDANRLVASTPWQDHLVVEGTWEVRLRLQPSAVQATWSLSPGAFQVAPSWTGLTMAVHGQCEGNGTASWDGATAAWSVDRASVSGPGWRWEGALSPRGPSGHRISGAASLDMATPFASWIPDMAPDVQRVLPHAGDLFLEGEVEWLATGHLRHVNARATLQDWVGTFDGIPYALDTRSLGVDGNTLRCDTATLSWGANVASFHDVAMSTPDLLTHGRWRGEARVNAQHLDIGAILLAWDHLELPEATEASLLPAGSDVELHLEAADIRWDALRGDNLTARARITDRVMTLRSLAFEALEGSATLEGTLKPGLSGWQFALRGALDDVSLVKLFSTYDNFGQTMIRHDHLGGALSSAGNLTMSWGLDGAWHPEHLTGSLQTSIVHGRLRHLEVFDEIADYLADHRLMAPLVDPEDLRNRLKDVEVEPVSQRVDIRGEAVWLPMTVIQSTAMNVAVEGTYGFDSAIDYTLGFALRDLRATASDGVGLMEDDGLGSQFFLRMHGPVDAPEYSYDREAAKAHRKDAIQAEKDRLREALRNRSNGSSDPPGSSESPPHAPAGGTSDVGPTGTASPAASTPPTVAPTEPKAASRDRRKQSRAEKNANLLNPDDEDYF